MMLYLPKVYYSENNISWYKHSMQFHNIDIFIQWNWRFWGFNPNVCQKRCLFDSYKNWKTALLHYMIGFSIEPRLTFNCSNQSIALIAYHFSINQSDCAELTKKVIESGKKHLGIDVLGVQLTIRGPDWLIEVPNPMFVKKGASLTGEKIEKVGFSTIW